MHLAWKWRKFFCCCVIIVFTLYNCVELFFSMMSIELNGILFIFLRVWNWDLRALVVSHWRNFITNLLKPQNFRKYSMWVKLLHKSYDMRKKENILKRQNIDANGLFWLFWASFFTHCFLSTYIYNDPPCSQVPSQPCSLQKLYYGATLTLVPCFATWPLSSCIPGRSDHFPLFYNHVPVSHIPL